jgi:polysaccharide deacetylase family protein (PEP-CTERM system associated)
LPHRKEANALSARIDNVDRIAGWAARPVTNLSAGSVNALTVDVEDYFQVEAFSSVVGRDEWNGRECRIERNVDIILQLFADNGVNGTFFTLGWVAQRYPGVVRRIVAGGHELASHGLAHYRADSRPSSELLQDAIDSRRILEDTGGVAVSGYRAASFSITRRNIWALDVLAEAGYRYSSSVNPIRHDLYGIPDAPRFAFYPLPGSDFIEIPISSIRRLGRNWPCGGGGFFRLLPYWLSVAAMRSVVQKEGQPCVFYFHPWEIDDRQPRIAKASLKSRLRHYTNLHKMAHRIERLLKEFKWARVDAIYPVKSLDRAAA